MCVYPAAQYPYWQEELGVAGMAPGAFGENFTVDGVDETRVGVGDVCQLGDATVQVSQPRDPCWKLARRWQVKDLAVRSQRPRSRCGTESMPSIGWGVVGVTNWTPA